METNEDVELLLMRCVADWNEENSMVCFCYFFPSIFSISVRCFFSSQYAFEFSLLFLVVFFCKTMYTSLLLRFCCCEGDEGSSKELQVEGVIERENRG